MKRNYLHTIDILWNWRYWPMEVLYLPLTLYILFVGSLRTGRLFYFAAANPKVSLGGFAGDSKMAIMQQIPTQLQPESVFISKDDTDTEQLLRLIQNRLQFPVIAKPDIGEGGFLVKKLNNADEWRSYHESYTMDYMVQEFIDDPIELSIHIQCIDGSLQISGVTEKQLLTIQGDGVSTINALLMQQKHTRYCRKKLRKLLSDRLTEVLAAGEIIQPGYIGNWNYGTVFHTRPEWNTEQLRSTMEQINTTIGLFEYARYDLKCSSVEALTAGNFKILEINGVKGEPIHIYDPANTLWGAYREIFRHWEWILQISRRNIRSGTVCPGARRGFSILIRHCVHQQFSLKSRIPS